MDIFLKGTCPNYSVPMSYFVEADNYTLLIDPVTGINITCYVQAAIAVVLYVLDLTTVCITGANENF